MRVPPASAVRKGSVDLLEQRNRELRRERQDPKPAVWKSESAPGSLEESAYGRQ